MKDSPVSLPLDALPLLVGSIDAGLLMDFLRRVEGGLAAKILQGFRPSRQTVRTPVVRQRLVSEASRKPESLDTRVMMWRDSAPAALMDTLTNLSAHELADALPDLALRFGGTLVWLGLEVDERKSVRKVGDKRKDELLGIEQTEVRTDKVQPVVEDQKAPGAATKPSDNEVRQLKKERTALREENRRMNAKLATALNSVAKSEAAASVVRKELAGARKDQERLQLKLGQEEQARREVEAENAELRRTLKELTKRLEGKPVEREQAKLQLQQRADVWPEVITRLLNNRHYDAVMFFCEELLSRSPNEPGAHLLLCRAYSESGAVEKAFKEHLWLTEYFLRDENPFLAVRHLLEAAAASPTSKRVAKLLDTLLPKLKLQDNTVASNVRRELQRFQSRCPNVCARISAALDRSAGERQRSAAGQQLQIHADKLFSLESNGRREALSAQGIINAINSNNTKLVEFARNALQSLKVKQGVEYQAIMDAIAAVDGGCITVLRTKGKPIVVDGSNVAFACKTDTGKPRLGNILLLRATLRGMGYFPLVIWADASLRYQVDQRASMEKLIAAEEILTVDPYTDADDTIIREAKRLGCAIVTNDRMLEGDPAGEVQKIRFDVDQNFAELRRMF